MTEIFHHPLPHAAVETANLLLLEHVVTLHLSNESLEILSQTLDGLVGKLFSARDELVVIGLVVCHIIPLGR